MSDNKKYLWLLAFAAVSLVYVFLRWWGLTNSCLWFDEIFGVHAAIQPWSEMFRFLAQDLIHPPLFYVLLKIWILLGGESLLWLRLFSVFWTTLAILPLVLLCRELRFRSSETLTGLILLAVNGLLVKYAQEVRMYSVLFCLALFSLWLFARFLNKSEKLVFAALLFANLLLVYTHYFGWLVVVSELAVVLFWRREYLTRFVAGFSFLILSFAPWIWAVYAASQTNSGVGQNIGWAQRPTLKNVLPLIFSLHEPFYYQQSNLDAPNLLLVALPFALICVCAIVAALIQKSDSNIRLLAVFAFFPFVVAFVASWILPYSIWGVRHLIVVFAPYALLIALALYRLRPSVLKIVAFGLLGALVLAGCAFHFNRQMPIYIWCGWENLARQAVEKDRSERMTIYAFEDLVAYHLWFATRGGSDRVQIVNVEDFPGVEEDKAYFLPRGFDDVKVADRDALVGARFWIAFRDAAWNESHPVLRDLKARGYKHGAPLEFRAQGLSAFLVLVEKQQ